MWRRTAWTNENGNGELRSRLIGQKKMVEVC